MSARTDRIENYKQQPQTPFVKSQIALYQGMSDEQYDKRIADYQARQSRPGHAQAKAKTVSRLVNELWQKRKSEA